MRIAICQAFLPPASQGGVGHFTDQLADRLVTGGHEVTVYSAGPAAPSARYASQAPDPPFSGRWSLTYGFAIWLARRSFDQFDIVHAMGDNHFMRPAPPVVRTLFGSALQEARRARRASTRAMYLSIYPLELAGSARAAVRVAISRSTAKDFPGVTEIVPPGVDLDLFRPGPKSEKPTILGLGHRLRDRKRLFLLVDAFLRAVKPRHPDAELWLVCDEPVEGPGIISVRSLPRQDLAALFGRAWVFCMPSVYEGFGIPYVEAMASGTVVVATPNPGIMDISDGGELAELCRPEDLGGALCAVLEDHPRRSRLEVAGRSRAAAYDWKAVVSSYEAIYQRLVA
jgi:phosphatidylinositol alpha-mannosyltransferase